MHRKSSSILVIVCLSSVMALGCAQHRYQYGVGRHDVCDRDNSAISGNRTTYGGSYPRLDRIERSVRVPVDFVKRHLPFKPKDEEERSPEELRQEAVSLSQKYLHDNRLTDVYVDVRRYEPKEQWARLKANNRISPIMKYTGGSLSVLKYSLLPGRLFQSDEYNPYTDTLSLNSTKPIEAFCEAGSAKVYHQQTWPGVYASTQYIPFVPIGHKAAVASDVITYAHENGMQEMERELYPHTYGEIAKTSVAQTFALFPVGTGVTQFVVPFAGEFVAEQAGEFAGKTVASQEASKQERNVDTTNYRAESRYPN